MSPHLSALQTSRSPGYSRLCQPGFPPSWCQEAAFNWISTFDCSAKCPTTFLLRLLLETSVMPPPPGIRQKWKCIYQQPGKKPYFPYVCCMPLITVVFTWLNEGISVWSLKLTRNSFQVCIPYGHVVVIKIWNTQRVLSFSPRWAVSDCHIGKRKEREATYLLRKRRG